MPAEGLRSHHCPDLVAIDVDVAHVHIAHNVAHPFVDPGMQAEGQAVAGGVLLWRLRRRARPVRATNSPRAKGTRQPQLCIWAVLKLLVSSVETPD